MPNEGNIVGRITLDAKSKATGVLLWSGDRFLAVTADRQLSAASVSAGDKRVWVDALGVGGSIANDGNASGADYRSGGIAAGIDFPVSPQLRIGAALGYSAGATDLDRAGAGRADVDSYHVGLCGELATGPWSLRGALGYTRHDVETRRDIVYGSIAGIAEADYHVNQYFGLPSGRLRSALVR